jgi:hypothetical protein
MKKWVPVVILMTLFLTCIIPILCLNRKKTGVDQSVATGYYNLCPSGSCVTTCVWYEDEIVKMYYIDMGSVTKDRVCKDKAKGDSVLKAIKVALE